ncbi:hypothetical protein RF679_17905 [Undibacterium cyanobacteriorum]|uniref:Uncharacterized protein n=1 Tax=Undibacterium cyanobacteriorum TaxID=3073561 RepID=A0ABY9RHR3_9BURK|nr:hypothetical protein [Undibacterium sp. 20NA77.5]WMW80491.1 hypothetical protein RF679_17905 [Undibacterium sp. 20NA77.5]
MSSLLAEILKSHHFEVELKACVAVIDKGHEERFLLGAKEFASPGQIPSHLVCVVNKTVLLDFGLGNARRTFAPDLFHGLILPLDDYHARGGGVLCSARLMNKYEIHYLVDALPETLGDRIRDQEAVLQKALKDYRRYARNRLKFNVAKAFKSVYKTNLFSAKKSPELARIAGDFNATWST